MITMMSKSLQMRKSAISEAAVPPPGGGELTTVRAADFTPSGTEAPRSRDPEAGGAAARRRERHAPGASTEAPRRPGAARPRAPVGGCPRGSAAPTREKRPVPDTPSPFPSRVWARADPGRAAGVQGPPPTRRTRGLGTAAAGRWCCRRTSHRGELSAPGDRPHPRPPLGDGGRAGGAGCAPGSVLPASAGTVRTHRRCPRTRARG